MIHSCFHCLTKHDFADSSFSLLDEISGRAHGFSIPFSLKCSLISVSKTSHPNPKISVFHSISSTFPPSPPAPACLRLGCVQEEGGVQ